MEKDILLCGIGGQGTVLSSKIIAASAMKEGNVVHSAETIGMAQRGGPVNSHIRIGEEAYSPLIPLGNADVIIAFEPSEAVRNLSYLKEDGVVIVNTTPVKPVTESLKDTGYNGKASLAYLEGKCRMVSVDGEAKCLELGSSKFLNILLLGVAAGTGALGIEKKTLESEIIDRVPVKFKEKNIEAFEIGYKMGMDF